MNFIDTFTKDDLKLLKIKEYNPQQIVKNEGAYCEEIGILLKGELLISTITYQEKEEIINIIKENEIFGLFLVHASSSYLGNIYAIKKSQIAFLKRDDLLKILSRNEKTLDAYLKILSDEALKIKFQAKLLAHKNIRDRILYFLYANSKNNIYIAASIESMAHTLGIPRPSLSRELILLKRDGIIKKDHNKIMLI